MKTFFITALCVSLQVGSIESYVSQNIQQIPHKDKQRPSQLNSMPPPMPGGGGPDFGAQEPMHDAPQNLPQGVGPLPGAPMVPMGPSGPQAQPQSYSGGMQQQQQQGYGGQGYGGQGYTGGYDDDNWYDSPNDYNSRRSTGWNNQGGAQKWWQSGVSQSNTLQGSSRKTWSSQDPWNQRSSHIHLESERPNSPLDATIDFLQGPGNVARRMKVWSMDGSSRPVRANFANPSGGSRGYSNTIDVKNTGPMEFPLQAGVSQSQQPMMYGGQGMMPPGQPEQPYQMAPGGMSGPMMGGGSPMGMGLDGRMAEMDGTAPMGGVARMGGSMSGMKQMKTIQGGSLKTYSFDPRINYVQVDIETDGMPCYATIEVSQGPGDARQNMEVYSDDGTPWQGIVETPGYGSTILVKNVGPMAYPIKCSCEPIG